MSHEQSPSWREALARAIPSTVADDIDTFESQMELRRQGKLEDKVFAELRLRRGAYGQRYDNGRRYDGEKTQEIPFPRRGLTKGPETEFDAPGMQRIKIPFGKLTAEQLEVLADCAEEYSNAVLHITTRQDVQYHFIDIEDTPDMHRRLASVGITTREACGNSVRNVTGCPHAGICPNEAFDISAYARAETFFLLGHRDVQDFGRKFKIAYSGCGDDGCGRVMMHDLGFVAQLREVDGREQRGFRVVVGGGLGPVPHVAKELYDFMPAEQMLPLSQAIARVYARLGEKRNRNKARIKFLVARLGIAEFKRLVEEELASMEPDPRWTEWLADAQREEIERRQSPATDSPLAPAPGFDRWHDTNVYRQRQPGFVGVSVNLPLGDITSRQSRAMADILRRYTAGDALRTTVDQNLLLRWVHERDLVAVYNDLYRANLARSGAATIADVTSCPGTDTCKLGVASSRGLAAELRRRLESRGLQYDPVLKHVHIKVSGCPNSCGLHHIGDIGFYGSSRNIGSYKVPHVLLLLGGSRSENAANYGLAIGAVPSRRAPEVVDRLLTLFSEERQHDEAFRSWVSRVGKKTIKERLTDLMHVPTHDEDAAFYVDWHDAREYSIGDIGVGECAGEVVSLTQFGLATAESKVFDASIVLDAAATDEMAQGAARQAYEAMVTAAQGLVKMRNPDIKGDAAIVFDAFRAEFVDTRAFFDRYVGASEWPYFQAAHAAGGAVRDRDEARRRVEEAQLFIEASYACYARLLQAQTAVAGSASSGHAS